jgi:hypothetical protein
MFKEPIMRAVAKHEDAIRFVQLVATEAAPAFGYQGALTCLSHGIKD